MTLTRGLPILPNWELKDVWKKSGMCMVQGKSFKQILELVCVMGLVLSLLGSQTLKYWFGSYLLLPLGIWVGRSTGGM